MMSTHFLYNRVGAHLAYVSRKFHNNTKQIITIAYIVIQRIARGLNIHSNILNSNKS